MGIHNAAGRQGNRPHHTDPLFRVRAGRWARPCRASRSIMALPQSRAANFRAQPGNGNRGCNNRQFHAQQLADLPRSPPDRMEVRARALVIRIDLQLRGSRECWHRHLAVHPAAFVLVGRGHRWRGHERRVELCRDLDLYLARAVNSNLPDLARRDRRGPLELLNRSTVCQAEAKKLDVVMR